MINQGGSSTPSSLRYISVFNCLTVPSQRDPLDGCCCRVQNKTGETEKWAGLKMVGCY